MECRAQPSLSSETSGCAATTIPHSQDRCRRSRRRLSKRRSSLRAPAQQYDLDGLEHDQNVQADRSVLNVEKIELQFFLGVLNRISVLVADLRPTGNSRTHHMADPVIRQFPGKPFHKLRTLRTRPHKSHVALQHA